MIVFLQFHNYLPLEKDPALHLNKLESPSPKDRLCQVWLKFGPVVLEKDVKIRKVSDINDNNNDNNNNDDDGQRTNCDQKSSLELR